MKTVWYSCCETGPYSRAYWSQRSLLGIEAGPLFRQAVAISIVIENWDHGIPGEPTDALSPPPANITRCRCWLLQLLTSCTCVELVSSKHSSFQTRSFLTMLFYLFLHCLLTYIHTWPMSSLFIITVLANGSLEANRSAHSLPTLSMKWTVYHYKTV